MDHRRVASALLCICALPLGCSLVKQVAASGLDKPKLTFKDAQLSEVALDGATVNLIFTVDNPNSQGLSLAETDYQLLVEGKQLVTGKPPGGLKIPANGSADVTLPASVKFKDLASSIAALLSQHSVAYTASGHIGVDTPLGLVALPFSHDGRLDLPKVPEVSVGSPRLKNFTLTGATLELPLTLSNGNSFALPLGAIAGTLEIEGSEVGSVQTPSIGSLAANGTQTVAVPVKIGFSNAVAAAKALRDGGGHINFQGELKSGDASIPFQVERDVTFSKDQTGAGGD